MVSLLSSPPGGSLLSVVAWREAKQYTSVMEGVKRDIYEDKWKMEEESKPKPRVCSKFLDRRWISLAILVFVNLINYADRYSLSAVLGVSLIVHLLQHCGAAIA